MANPSVVSDVRAPYSGGLTFRGFLHHTVVDHTATNPPKITKIVQGDRPSEQISLTGVWLCDSSMYNQINRKGGGSNRRIWHIAAYIIKSHLAISSLDKFLVHIGVPSTQEPLRLRLGIL